MKSEGPLPSAMANVAIEYFAPCGLFDDAKTVRRHLLEAFGEELEDVELVQGDGGVFRVQLDDGIVFDGQEEHYDREALLAGVHDRLETPGADA